MTWGQLRLQLQTAAPGVALDLLDEFLNGRYGQVLAKTDWSGRTGHGTITTQAAYQSSTDSVTLTIGNTGVTGAGTNWQTTIVGQRFYRPGDTVIYTVAARGGTTSLTLDRAYEGNGVDATGTVFAGSAYVFMQHIYALPSDADSVVSILDPVTGFPLGEFTKSQLDASAGPRTLINDPTSWAPYDDTSEASPPVLHQVELFPPPLRARGFPLEYLKNPNLFTGANTTASALPFCTDQVLLYGCRADIAAYLATQEQGMASVHLATAKMYEAKYQEELATMLRVEHLRRRPLAPMRMASRFTRHRMERANRGLSNGWGPGQGGPN